MNLAVPSDLYIKYTDLKDFVNILYQVNDVTVHISLCI